MNSGLSTEEHKKGKQMHAKSCAQKKKKKGRGKRNNIFCRQTKHLLLFMSTLFQFLMRLTVQTRAADRQTAGQYTRQFQFFPFH